ncbi:hypothetical protein [Caballeronia sordidicola]|jgi:hypothetical protein|uniref:hypothetical protein n=1 Tax=Caballeronia sordidicola TaxID=196367 RepID=UPI00094D0E37|nr:hypothetical protein [Caballeronia sordidicola]
MKQIHVLGVILVKRDLADCFVIMNQVVRAAISLCRIKNALLLQYIAADIFDLLHWKAAEATQFCFERLLPGWPYVWDVGV